MHSWYRYKLPEGTPNGAPLRSWLLDWLKQRVAYAKDLVDRDPQKLLERLCQVSFAANAVIQVRCKSIPAVPI